MILQRAFEKIPFFMAIFVLGLSCFLFVSFFQKINNINNQTRGQEMTWQKEYKKNEVERSLSHLMKNIEKQRLQIESHFALSRDVVPFLDSIESLASKANVAVEVNSVDISGDDANLLVGVNVEGSFNDVYKFISLLENSSYLLEFVSMNIHKEILPDKDGKPVISLNWEGSLQIKLLSFIK